MRCPHIAWAMAQGKPHQLSASELLVLMVLSEFADGAALNCWPAVETIAETARLDERTVRKALVRLEGSALIRIERKRFKSHVYRILRPADPPPVEGTAHTPQVKDIDRGDNFATPDEAAVNPRGGKNEPPSADRSDNFVPPGVAKMSPPGAETGVTKLLPEPLKEERKKEESPLNPPKADAPASPALRTGQGSRLPENWKPDNAGLKFARDQGLDPMRALAKFHDYWRGVPGQKGCKLDWPATWRNSCRAEADRQPNRQRGQTTTPSGFTPMVGGL